MKKLAINYIRKAQGKSSGRTFLDQLLLSFYAKYRGFKRSLRQVENPAYGQLYLKSRNLSRNLSGKNFKFVSIHDATVWTAEWIKTFPVQYDLVIGIPRSGMLVASIVALKLGKGLTTPELFRDGKFWNSSFRNDRMSIDKVKRVILIDDSVDKGRAMSDALDLILSMNDDIAVTKAALIVRQEVESMVDLFHKVIAPPRLYEWSILHRKIASYWEHGILASDMDGVLCEDCPADVDHDEVLYLDWIRSAKPYFIPIFEIDAIVTSRLEKYRPETEEWLRLHKVKYKTLHMWNISSKKERNGKFARYKIEELTRIKPDMFWESSWPQSQSIWDETRIPTLCIDEMTLLN